jgi:hypothetical protein
MLVSREPDLFRLAVTAVLWQLVETAPDPTVGANIWGTLAVVLDG